MQPASPSHRSPHSVSVPSLKAFPGPPPGVRSAGFWLQMDDTEVTLGGDEVDSSANGKDLSREQERKTVEWKVQHENLHVTFSPKKFLPTTFESPECSPDSPASILISDHDHSQCQVEIDELRARLQYYKDSLTSSSLSFKLKAQIQSWKDLESLRKRELAHMISLSSHLQDQIIDVQRTKSLLFSQLEAAKTLEIRLRGELEPQRTMMSPPPTRRMEETRKDCMLTPRLNLLAKPFPEPPTPSPFPFSDSHLQSLNLRTQSVLSRLTSDSTDPDAIEAEINAIEAALISVADGKHGKSRIKTQLNSAKNRVIRLKSIRAISGADRTLLNIQGALKAAEQSFLKSPRSTFETIPLRTSSESKESLMGGVEKERWSYMTETINSQESVIKKLREELEESRGKVREMERKEEKVERMFPGCDTEAISDAKT